MGTRKWRIFHTAMEGFQAVNAQGQSDRGCIDVTDVKRGQLEVRIGQFDILLSSLLWAWHPSHGVFFIKTFFNYHNEKINQFFFLSLYKSATDCSIRGTGYRTPNAS